MAIPLPVRSKPPLPPGAERRRFERFELLAQVEVRHRGEVAVMPIINISAGGLLLRVEDTELAVEVDDAISVFLQVDDLAEPIEMTMDASVVRATPSTIALMWTSTNSQDVEQLAKLLGQLSRRAA